MSMRRDGESGYALESMGPSLGPVTSSNIWFALIPLGLFALIFNFRFALFVLFVSLVGIAVITRHSLIATLDWRRAKLIVPTRTMPLGSQPVVVYRRDSKKPRDIGEYVVEVELFCQEEVRYRQGTDTVTDRSVVFTEKFAMPGAATASGIEAELQIEIPVHAGAPNMDLGDNKIEWFVVVATNGPKLPKDKERFAVQVSAVLESDGRSDRPQDTIAPSPERPQDTL